MGQLQLPNAVVKPNITANTIKPTQNASQNTTFVPGPIRVKRCPPTIAEAVAAARDLADDVAGQIEIAAGLMGVGPEAVRDEVERAAAESRNAEGRQKSGAEVMVRDRSGGARAVVVQRTSRSARPAVTVERKRYAGLGSTPRPGTVRTFDLTRRSSREG